MTEVTERDRDIARGLPDEFVELSGAPMDRVRALVALHWLPFAAPARAELMQALLFVLRPLLEPGAVVTDQKRDTCEGIVATWLAEQ